MTTTRSTATPPAAAPAPTPAHRREVRAVLGAAAVTLAAVGARGLLPAPPTVMGLVPGFATAAAALAAATVVLAARRADLAGGMGSRAGRWRRALAWSAAAVLLATTADGIAFDVVGVVMDAVAFVSGRAEMIAVPLDVAGIAVRLSAGATGVLLVRRTLRQRRHALGLCPACGRDPARPAPRAPRWPAYSAAVLGLGYAAEKVHWGLGGTIGLADPDAFGDVSLWTPGLGDTAVLGLVGVAIALALVRPWGRRLPAWLPRGGAVLGALMLVPVGLLGSGVVVADLLAGDATSTAGLAPWVVRVQYPWFLAWGLSLAAAALVHRGGAGGGCEVCGRRPAV